MYKLVLSLFLSFFFSFWTLTAQNKDEHYTVIVSLDAFRWDYPQMYNTPNLDKMAEEGVKATMIPSYPASTYPNHYTIATGLVPDHTGLINNTFWDVKKQQQFSMRNLATRNNPEYYRGEPIWITAQKQGIKTGTVYWVGSDICIQNSHPTYYHVYDKQPRLTFEERVNEALSLLNKPETERPRLVMIYFEEPDGVTHHYGPRSPEAQRIVFRMDSLVGMLREGIAALPFSQNVNLIVTADHGMTEISADRVVYMNKYIKPEWCEMIDGHTPTSIFTKPTCRDSVYNALKEVAHIRVWKKEEIPAELNYGSSEYVGDIVVAPELGWQFTDKPLRLKGAHGYFPESPDMQVVFRACGPDFKQKYESKGFINVDIYPLLAHLLRITPVQTDGQFKRVEDLLRNHNN